jgi:hypothetical protein
VGRGAGPGRQCPLTAAALLLCLPLPAPGPDPALLPDVRPSDRFRFPPHAVLYERVRFAERHLEWLDRRAAALGPDWAAREYGYRAELVRRLDLWREARGAAEADERHAQLCWLRDLRRSLGVAAYNAGELPALPDPAWFSRAD